MRSRQAWLVMIVLIGMTLPVPAEAGGLSNTETFGGFQFNFNNPGARALGMGGPSIGLADDATAAVTNPAGLVILQRPELSGEVKFTRFKNNIKAFSNSPGDAPNATVHDRDFDDSVTTPSFFSFVYPTERLVVAVFTRELVHFDSNFETEGVFLQGFRLFPAKPSLDVTALNVGAGVGLNLSRDYRLLPDIGGSIEFSHGEVHSKLQRFGCPPGCGTLLGDPNFAGDHIVTTSLVDGSDIGVGFNIGALWRPVKESSLGAVYRRGPRYNMRQTVEAGPLGLVSIQPPVLITPPRQIYDFSLKVPDVYGIGAAYRPLDRLTIAADAVRIKYSQLRDGFQLVFNSATDLQPKDYKLDDATEFHVGAEYVMFLRSIPIAARAGFFTDPDHRIRYRGADVTSRVLFPGGRDQYHGTAGLGFVPFPGVQFDFATNISSEIREFSISTVFRF